ncbi:MAG TPA: ABC transporter ATP-binding protein [Xanthobacteraceae bacterium]|jgi:NitT/TauT family transport system ATP-binding protein
MLRLKNISKRFLARERVITAVEQISLDVASGELLTLVGPSGCGKSTILNIASGLMRPTEGSVELDGRPIAGVTRDIGYVTQQPNLMPWRTLIDNVSFPLQVAGVVRSERHDRAAKLIAMVGLAGFERSYPHELSGGMRQRANIIRTLIYAPKVMLMDEPFGPLDAQTRVILQDQLLDIWTRTGVTIVFITHDLSEAIGLGDRVALMSARPGRIIRIDQVGISRPRDVFHMHDSGDFRALYDTIWAELERQVREPGTSAAA